MTIDNTDTRELAQAHYQTGMIAFERGRYRQSVECLEKAANLADRTSRLGGEIQLLLVSAYHAAGRQQDAIALCERLGSHFDLKTRKQSRRLLYILKAPVLKTRPEWLTQIPDLAALDDASRADKRQFAAAGRPSSSRPRRPQPEPESIDWSQVNTKDNGFVWIALVATVLIVGGLLWLS